MHSAVPINQSAEVRDPLFTPVRIGSLQLANRTAVAPMTRVSATPYGLATPAMAAYYPAFAKGGFGLVISEGVYTDKAYSQGYLNQPGLTDTDQIRSWRSVTEAVHASGAPIIAQLMHAGALAQGNAYRSDTIAPSAIRPLGRQMTAYGGGGEYALPRAAGAGELAEVVAGFARSALAAREAGFDGVELHAANGYLLNQFLSEFANARTDGYGGSTASRVRFIVEVTEAVRKVAGPDFVVGVRLSQAKVNDFDHRWSGGVVDAETIFRAVAEAGADFIHTTQFEAWASGFGEGTPGMAAMARAATGLPVIANGSLHDPERARALIASDDAQMVSLGRGALGSAAWPNDVRAGATPDGFDAAILEPRATLANAERKGRPVHRGQGGQSAS